ncbi:MAG: prohibitin family protein [Sediminibacterium sp.]|nr:prohibitin family protein [Sediminibacterium sp.]
MKRNVTLLTIIVILVSSCTVIRQGEVGVKRRLGKIDPVYVEQGPKGYNLFTTTILKVPTRSMNIEVKPDLPSKEGLTIRSEISILYRIKPEAAPKIVQNIGLNYESEVILPVFRSASADITAKFLAKDMHSGERGQIESAIRKQMIEILEPRGLVIDNVLMKSIRLPEALAVKKANDTINKTLTPTILKLRQIEAFKSLSNSNNSKLIITDGKTPFLSLPEKF